MKEKTDLNKKIGKENPFKVPEGYFENIVPQIMERLPEPETPEEIEITLWERVKPWVYMVAMFCGLMFSIKVIMGEKNNISSQTKEITAISTDSIQSIPDELIDPIVDQTMMDDYTLYMYLTDADTDFLY